jgi:uncharacterized protein YdbL (DUF1318 family)
LNKGVNMKLVKWLSSLLTGFMLVSCVTINIYFPAAAAEKAADRIIEDVWGPAVPHQEEKPEATQEQSSRLEPLPVAIHLLNWITTPAVAAEANLNISSPAINKIQSQMKQRHNQLKAYYASGAVGLTNQGLVTVRDAKAIPLKERNKVKGLVADENKDRNALYAEIARANGHPEWKADIQATFAQRWIKKAAKGWWYNSGGWKQK